MGYTRVREEPRPQEFWPRKMNLLLIEMGKTGWSKFYGYVLDVRSLSEDVPVLVFIIQVWR